MKIAVFSLTHSCSKRSWARVLVLRSRSWGPRKEHPGANLFVTSSWVAMSLAYRKTFCTLNMWVRLICNIFALWIQESDAPCQFTISCWKTSYCMSCIALSCWQWPALSREPCSGIENWDSSCVSIVYQLAHFVHSLCPNDSFKGHWVASTYRHQDQPYYPIDGGQMISVWMPVDPVPEVWCLLVICWTLRALHPMLYTDPRHPTARETCNVCMD